MTTRSKVLTIPKIFTIIKNNYNKEVIPESLHWYFNYCKMCQKICENRKTPDCVHCCTNMIFALHYLKKYGLYTEKIRNFYVHTRL